jgi:hypothetical protein
VPTIVQYVGDHEVEIGAAIEARRHDPHVARSTIRPPKHLLGRSDEGVKIEVVLPYSHDRKYYSPREVVSDYLRQIRLRAEEKRQAIFKRIIVTHPARFSLKQLQEYKAAVRDAFGTDCEILTLQEPVAAALDFMLGDEVVARENYTLGVFDFGGGTTDLSLLRVDNIRDQGFLEVRAQLLSSTGKWFGGVNVTNYVMSQGLERCRTIAQRLRPQAEIPTQSGRAVDPSRDWLGRINQIRLERWAEESKLLLVEHGDRHTAYLPALPGVFPLTLNVFTGGGFEEVSFPQEDIVPRQIELYSFLESEVDALARMMAQLVEVSDEKTLNYLLLSGQSSRIPVVRDVLSRRFPNTEIKIAKEPKECVVSGACLLEKFQDAPDMILSIDGTAATTSRIGLEDRLRGVFWEWFPAGKPIPKTDLVLERPYLLRPGRPIILLENEGDEDALSIMGKRNTSINELGTYVLESWPDWLPATRPTPVKLELRVTQSLEYSLFARVEGRNEVLAFKRVSEAP